MHVYRGLVFSQAISDGAILPRWTQFLHLGLGSPVFTFYGPLSYYGMDLLYRIGIPHPVGWRILIAGGLLLGFFGTYLLVYTLTRRKWPSLLAAVVFLFAPYVLRNTLGRGSPEAFSMGLYPWVIWSLSGCRDGHPVALSTRQYHLAAYCKSHPGASHAFAVCLAGGVALVLEVSHGDSYSCLGGRRSVVALIWVPLLTKPGSVHIERDFFQEYANPLESRFPWTAC